MKRTVILLIMTFFIGYVTWGQTPLRDVIINGNLSALDNIIDENELWSLDQGELRILRNTIFAKYGYIFQSADLQNHFRQFSWYVRSHSNVDNRLTSIDRENIRLIQEIEHFRAGTERNRVDYAAWQNRLLSWIQQERITLPQDTVSFNGINLYKNPALYSESPYLWMPEFQPGPGIIVSLCFGMGQFLTPSESNQIIQIFNNGDNQFIYPDNVLVFNPSAIFMQDILEYREEGIYLVIGYGYGPLSDEGIGRNILIIGSSH